MRRIVIGIAIVVALASMSATAYAQSWRPPADYQRCPSKWGAADERGSGNHMKAESVLRATRLIKTGEVIELSYVLNSSMPLVGTVRIYLRSRSSRYAAAWATSSSNSRASSLSSGCQSTPTVKRRAGSSSASTVPSGARAACRRPVPRAPKPWWWLDFTSCRSPDRRPGASRR